VPSPKPRPANAQDRKPQDRKPRSGRLSAAARRAQLVEVGRKVFAERGFEAASVEEIADRAKVSKPIVYEHFGGKEGLYAVVVDREVEHIVARISEAMATGSPRERLEAAVLAYLTYVEERPEGFAVLLRDSPRAKGSGQMPALMYELADRVGDVFTDLFRQAGYDAKTAPIYAHALVGMVAFVGQWWTENRKPPPAETVASHVAALGWMGLRHLPRRPALQTAARRS
jgi:AcrR family transcriptional regulator